VKACNNSQKASSRRRARHSSPQANRYKGSTAPDTNALGPGSGTMSVSIDPWPSDWVQSSASSLRGTDRRGNGSGIWPTAVVVHDSWIRLLISLAQASDWRVRQQLIVRATSACEGTPRAEWAWGGKGSYYLGGSSRRGDRGFGWSGGLWVEDIQTFREGSPYEIDSKAILDPRSFNKKCQNEPGSKDKFKDDHEDPRSPIGAACDASGRGKW
jgi:hypothetical protein